MPELPEVETMRRGIASVAGRRIERAAVIRRASVRPLTVWPSASALQRRLRGARIEAVERLGKRVILALEGGDRLVFEPRMTGLVLLTDPPTAKHLRARLTLSGKGKAELLFWDRRGLGTLSLYGPDEFAERLGPDRIGPDAWGIPASVLRDRLDASRRAVKVALLDQRALAGVGNIYACEALHVARLAPERPCCSLTRAEWRRLAKALDGVLSEAVRYEGSTLGDGTYRNALNQDGSYQAHHRVYARAGEDCPRCGDAVVVRTVLGQRATFACPRCQG